MMTLHEHILKTFFLAFGDYICLFCYIFVNNVLLTFYKEKTLYLTIRSYRRWDKKNRRFK